MVHSVWCDFDNGALTEYQFKIESEQSAFLDGVTIAADGFGLDDYRLFYSLDEALVYYGETELPLPTIKPVQE